MIKGYGVLNDRSPHIIADLCEIMSYFEDKSISRSDVESFIQNYGGDGLFKDLKIDTDESTETNAKIQLLSEETFLHLVYRSRVFGNWYPFVIKGDVISLRAKITDRHKIYAALLGYSRLKMFSRTNISRFAHLFEILCYHATTGLFKNWSVFHFGQNGIDRAKFGTKKCDALQKLAEKLRDTPVLAHIEKLPANDHGDAGIDIVAIKEWNDNANSVIAFFGQCAAQQANWPEKRLEAHSLELRDFITFFHDPGNMMFIPICYRNPDGNWIDRAGRNTVLIDRLRLIEILEKLIQESKISKITRLIDKPFEPGCSQSSTA